MSLPTFLFVLVALTVAQPGWSQSQPTRDTGQPRATSEASTLASGWNALASGRGGDALAAVQGLLKANPADHNAVTIAIEARRLLSDAPGALDAYERWLTASRHEDPFLLRPIGLTFLDASAAASDPLLRARAVQALVSEGDRKAISSLSRMAKDPTRGPSLSADLALAVAGDATAETRLHDALEAPTTRNRAAILQDPDSSKVVPVLMLVRLLKDPEPLTRAAAADALGRQVDQTALEPLREAQRDPVSLVRVRAALGLARLRDPAAVDSVRQMITAETGEVRVIAARVLAELGETGWAEEIRTVLVDEDPLARVAAADLLATRPEYRTEALAVMTKELQDANPVVQQVAAAALAPALVASDNLVELRRLLRDSNAWVRLHAAAGLLRALRRQ